MTESRVVVRGGGGVGSGGFMGAKFPFGKVENFGGLDGDGCTATGMRFSATERLTLNMVKMVKCALCIFYLNTKKLPVPKFRGETSGLARA